MVQGSEVIFWRAFRGINSPSSVREVDSIKVRPVTTPVTEWNQKQWKI